VSSKPGRMLSGRSLAIPLLFLLFLGLVASRRWEQITSPQVWAEDGLIIDGFVRGGWHDFLQPVNGYLILVPKLITWISLALSIYYYPIASTILACIFSALVGLAVAIAPTRLLGKILCAISVFLVPSDPEVFGVPLLTLWWAPVLLLLVATWDERHPAIWLRLMFLAVGGLSSPFILFVLPVLYFRVFWHRELHSEKIVALAATAFAAVQMSFLSTGGWMAFSQASSFLIHAVPKFCGWFLIGNFSERAGLLWPSGILVIALIAAFLRGGRRDPSAWILVYLYCAAIAASAVRVDPAALHPILGGPRYFFFPFVLTFWILVQLVLAAGKGWLRNTAGILALVAVLNAVPQWSRRHDDLQWAKHLVSARLFPVYAIPIESDGHWFRAWSIAETGAVWDDLLRRDPFVSHEDLEGLPTFAYRVVGPGEGGGRGPAAWSGAGNAEGSGAISVASAGSRKEVDIRLGAGGRIRFRSGPVTGFPSMEIVGHEGEFIPELPKTTGWVTLEFSNARLPREFTVRVRDLGQGVGEWSASGR
jgi:hypothetical protein